MDSLCAKQHKTAAWGQSVWKITHLDVCWTRKVIDPGDPAAGAEIDSSQECSAPLGLALGRTPFRFGPARHLFRASHGLTCCRQAFLQRFYDVGN